MVLIKLYWKYIYLKLQYIYDKRAQGKNYNESNNTRQNYKS